MCDYHTNLIAKYIVILRDDFQLMTSVDMLSWNGIRPFVALWLLTKSALLTEVMLIWQWVYFWNRFPHVSTLTYERRSSRIMWCKFLSFFFFLKTIITFEISLHAYLRNV